MTITMGYYLLAVATIHLELIGSDVGKLNKNLEMAFARRLLTALHLRTKSCPRAAVEDQELDSLAQATRGRLTEVTSSSFQSQCLSRRTQSGTIF